MEPAVKRARTSDGRALPTVASSTASLPIAAAVAAAAAVPSFQPRLTAQMTAISELMSKHPQQASNMLAAAEGIVAMGPWK
jgi:hypothetical protein